ncbi:head GIN domain-containing protein [Pontibacter roseus]|uniref:head GIN domain-containing protein n=1 Tax=Pontibacter roseus TaxID=336989 RepID=UPI00037FE999|nr:head GIN domain-containing protein [Pontibacter roseus]
MKSFKYFLRLGLLTVLAAPMLSSCGDEADCVRGRGDVETRELNLDALDGVRVNGSTRVFVRRGATQHVEVKGQSNVLDALSTEVRNGTWDLSFDRCLRSHTTVEVYITVPEFTEAEMIGSGRIELQDQFEANEFRADLDGSGSIKANVVASKVSSILSGSGSIDLLGEATVQEVNLSGSGSVKAFSLSTQNTGVQLSGSGSAEVNASDNLTVSISGSGNVYYRGDPTIQTNIAGSGKVIKR